MSNHASPDPGLLVRKLARISGKPEHGEALSDALCDLEFATRQEPGCREFAFFRALSDPDSFVLLEAFDNQAAFELHMTLPHTQRFFAAQLVANVTVTPMDA